MEPTSALSPQWGGSRPRRSCVELSTLHRALEALSTAEWARPKRCTDAAPDGGAAPRATLARCREAAAELKKIPASEAAAALDAVCRSCESEQALAKRLCDLLEIEVSSLLALGRPAHEDAIAAAVDLLGALHSLAASVGGARSLTPLILPQLLEFVLMGIVSAWGKHWKVVRRQLLPVYGMVFDKELGLVHEAPHVYVALMSARLGGILSGGHRPKARGDLEVQAPSVKTLYAAGLLAQEIIDKFPRDASPVKDGELKLETMAGLQAKIMEHIAGLASRPAAPAKKLKAVEARWSQKLTPEKEDSPEVLALLQSAGSGEGDFDGLFTVITELCGGAAEMAAKLGSMAERQIAQLVSQHGKHQELPKGALEGASGVFSSIAHLLQCLLQVKDKSVATEDIVRHLVRCLLRASVLPPGLRPCVKPFHDVVMQSHVIHTASSELWALMPASGSVRQLEELPQPSWLYAAGCLAVDIKEALKDTDASSETVRKMESLQWSAHFHLAWSGYTAPPPSVPFGGAKADAEQPPREETSEKPEMQMRVSHGPPSAAETSDVEAEVSEDVDDSSDTSSANDRASDLEEFIDLAPEYNTFGLLRSIAPQAAQGADEPADEPAESATRPEASTLVKEFVASQIVPDWQARCRRLLKRHPVDSDEEAEEPSVSPTKRPRALAEA